MWGLCGVPLKGDMTLCKVKVSEAQVLGIRDV